MRTSSTTVHVPMQRRCVIAVTFLWCSLCCGWAHLEIEEQIAAITLQLEEKPDDPDLYLQRAELHRFHKDWKLASADYGQAEKLDPKLTAVRLGRGRMLLESGEFESAKSTLDGVLKEKPDEAQAFFLRGRAVAKLGRAREAVRDFDSALPIMHLPTAEHYLERARTLVGMKDIEANAEAIRGIEQGIARLGSLNTLHRYAAEIEVASGHTDEAIARIDALVVKTKGHLEWLKMRADVLADSGRCEEAAQAYKECLAKIDQIPAHRQAVPLIVKLKLQTEAAIDKLTSWRSDKAEIPSHH